MEYFIFLEILVTKKPRQLPRAADDLPPARQPILRRARPRAWAKGVLRHVPMWSAAAVHGVHGVHGAARVPRAVAGAVNALRREGVAPRGVMFWTIEEEGAGVGERRVRISFPGTTEHVREAMRRLAAWWESEQGQRWRGGGSKRAKR